MKLLELFRSRPSGAQFPQEEGRRIFLEHIEPLFRELRSLHQEEAVARAAPPSEMRPSALGRVEQIDRELRRGLLRSLAKAQVEERERARPDAASRFFTSVVRYFEVEVREPRVPKAETGRRLLAVLPLTPLGALPPDLDDELALGGEPEPSSQAEEALALRWAEVADTYAVARARLL